MGCSQYSRFIHQNVRLQRNPAAAAPIMTPIAQPNMPLGRVDSPLNGRAFGAINYIRRICAPVRFTPPILPSP